MATVHRPGPNSLEKLSWYLGHCKHTVWDQFSDQERKRMIDDDIAAGISVSLVLGSLITAGMVLAIVTLAAVLLAS